MGDEGSEPQEESASVSALPLRLFVLGFVLVLVGVAVVIIAGLLSGGQSSVSGGVVIVIGFIPIVIGAGPYGFYAVLIGAVLTVIAFAVFVWMRRQASKN